MKACILRGARDLVLGEIAEPSPGPGEVVIRLGACGICGTDLHYFADGANGDFRVREPLVLGHEAAGEVVAVGPNVIRIKPGDRVAVNPSQSCGNCPQCRAGRRHLCRNARFYGSAATFPHVQGAMAERFLAREGNCHAFPAGISLRAAACSEPLAVALHAVSQAGPIAARDVIIVGSGPIGVLVAAAARMAGAARICVTDVLDEPLAVARAMGATETINVGKEAARLGVLGEGGGTFGAAFEASGNPLGLAAAIDAVQPGGTVVQIGVMPRDQAQVPLHKVMSKELRLVGTFRFDREYGTAAAALATGRIDVTPMLTHEFTFDELGEAFAVAADKRSAMKVTLSPA